MGTTGAGNLVSSLSLARRVFVRGVAASAMRAVMMQAADSGDAQSSGQQVAGSRLRSGVWQSGRASVVSAARLEPCRQVCVATHSVTRRARLV